MFHQVEIVFITLDFEKLKIMPFRHVYIAPVNDRFVSSNVLDGLNIFLHV